MNAGFQIGDASVLQNCASHGNTAGFASNGGAHLIGCTAQNNTNSGFNINLQAAVFENCIARSNGFNGFVGGDGSLISRCIAQNNARSGIQAGASAALSDCTATGNTSHGILTGNHGSIMNCIANDNDGDGINAGFSSIVERCVTRVNGFNGISVNVSATVVSCTAFANTNHGIRVFNGARVLNNVCAGNGNGVGDGAGIYVSNGNSYLEGNVTHSNDRGIEADGIGTVVVRNYSYGNFGAGTPSANYDVPPGQNLLGNIINSSAALNTATNANVNFTY
jgi:hypothetical protein